MHRKLLRAVPSLSQQFQAVWAIHLHDADLCEGVVARNIDARERQVARKSPPWTQVSMRPSQKRTYVCSRIEVTHGVKACDDDVEAPPRRKGTHVAATDADTRTNGGLLDPQPLFEEREHRVVHIDGKNLGPRLSERERHASCPRAVLEDRLPLESACVVFDVLRARLVAALVRCGVAIVLDGPRMEMWRGHPSCVARPNAVLQI